jgi:putative ABC transport system permease protein
MTTPWHKAIRDFWHERTRTALVVLAIAAGIAGFSTVLSTYAILVRELNDGYLATNPASATLWVDRADAEVRRAVLSGSEVSDAEARRVITGRIKAGPMEWRNLTLFVVEDYGNIRVSTLKHERGAWPPKTGEILIERDAFQVLHARIGDWARVKTANGSEKTLRITGSVHDVGQAQARMENAVYGYITLATLAQLGEEPWLDQLKIIVAKNRYDEQHIRDVVAGVVKRIESRGHAVRRVEIPPPGKHPHAQIMGLLLLAMSSFGLLVLFLSGILVVNLLMALMAAQVRQIGVMKAIGGSRSQIARLYLSQALLLGGAGIIIAIPAGIWGSRAFCLYMAMFLNFDINRFAVPVWVYAAVIVVGVVVPLLAAAYPVWKGTAVPVREAIADVGVSRNQFGTTAFDRLLAGTGGLTRPMLFAIRNSFRRRTRLVLTVATLAAGGTFFMSALNVRATLANTIDGMFARRKADLVVFLDGFQPTDRVERAVRNTPGIARAEEWIAAEGSLGNGREEAPVSGLHGNGSDHFAVVAMPSGANLLTLDIISGRNLLAGDSNAIVLNDALALKLPRAKVGDVVTLRIGPRPLTWRIAGIAREPFSPPVAYVTKPFFEQLAGISGTTNQIRLALKNNDTASIKRVKTALESNLARENVTARGTLTNADSRYGFDQHMVMIYVFLVVMSAIIVGVGGLGLTTTLSLNVMERRREMGVLRAIGASARAVWLIVVAEGSVISALSAVVAALVAWPVSRALANGIVSAIFRSDVDFSFETRGLVIWIAVSMFLAAVASFIPAWQSSRGSIREALGYE